MAIIINTFDGDTVGRCVKQEVVAVIHNNGKFWIGRNDCLNPQYKCPRGDMPSGQGYDLCKTVCKQIGHAEEVACKEAGEEAEGGELVLFGHNYCCDKCVNIMKEHKLKGYYIGKEYKAL
jgi:hypothetical protein